MYVKEFTPLPRIGSQPSTSVCVKLAIGWLEKSQPKGLYFVTPRRLIAIVLSVVALLAVFVPAASAEGTGRFERCAVQTPDRGTVIVAYTLEDQGAVQMAAAQCSYLISTGAYVIATNHVGLTDNPDFDRVCMVEFSSSNSLNVFYSVFRPSSYRVAEAACDAADDGSALVTYD
jgi:hypothetical protein